VIYGSRIFRNGTPLRGVTRVRGVDVFGPQETLRWLALGPQVLSDADVQRLAAAATQVLPPSQAGIPARMA
jgi:hypothetical protein